MNKTDISIIIPVFNQEKGIHDTLESLLKLSYPRENLEIIVIDNNSKDGTLNVAGTFHETHPALIRILTENTVQSSYAARNKGIAEAKGDIIVFLDADVTVKAELLEDIEDFIKKNDALYLGFDLKVYSSQRENVFEKYDRLTGFPVAEFIKCKHFSPTACLAIRKKLLDKVGGFDDRLVSSGDYEFGNRVFNAGIKLHFAPHITAYHPARNSFGSLAKQYFRKGRGKAQVRQYAAKLHDLALGLKRKYPPYSIFSGIQNFKLKVRGWKNLSIRDKTAFMLLWTCLSLIEHAGYISEHLKIGSARR